MNEKKHEKNYGIEWLRILSMYMVAVLHTLGQGGTFGAVDCFALISGYVGYH